MLISGFWSLICALRGPPPPTLRSSPPSQAQLQNPETPEDTTSNIYIPGRLFNVHKIIIFLNAKQMHLHVPLFIYLFSFSCCSLREKKWFSSIAYLLLHCAKLWVKGLKVVSEIALSVHGSLEVPKCHFTQPVSRRCQSKSLHSYTHTCLSNINSEPLRSIRALASPQPISNPDSFFFFV